MRIAAQRGPGLNERRPRHIDSIFHVAVTLGPLTAGPVDLGINETTPPKTAVPDECADRFLERVRSNGSELLKPPARC